MRNCGSLMKADLVLTARLGMDGLKPGSELQLYQVSSLDSLLSFIFLE